MNDCDLPFYFCPRCGAKSFNLNDIAERYCGRCHRFEDDIDPPVRNLLEKQEPCFFSGHRREIVKPT
jgi:NADH pyrophosphatase NudC (nudix superfamily)